MTHNRKKTIIQHYLDAYQRFDIADMTSNLDPDLVFKNITAGEVTVETHGLDQFRALAAQSLALFSSRQQTPINFVFTGNEVVVDIKYRALLAVDLAGLGNAGDEVNLLGTSKFLFNGDLIVRITDTS